jgi:GNAT superfamily N-acetyltransferase
MKRNILIIISFGLLALFNLTHTEIEYRKANIDDVPGLLDLINNYAIKDNDKIVILPEKFRANYIKELIEEEKIFVAMQTSTSSFPEKTEIIGYKKLFLFTDKDELDSTLINELHCKELLDVNGAFIYDGSDFTHPDYRGRGINSNLTLFALDSIKDQ